MLATVSRSVLTAALGLTIATAPAIAAAPQQHAAHKTDALDAKLTARIQAVDVKLTAARKAGRVSAAQATQMRKKLDWVRVDSARYVRKQGFLSAGESASYNRTLDALETKLG